MSAATTTPTITVDDAPSRRWDLVGRSSWGAGHPEGTGPVKGLHRFEQRLSAVAGVDTLWLRAGYFMENLLSHVHNAATHHRISAPFDPDLPLPFVSTPDIGARAGDELATGTWHGTEILELQGGRDVSMREAVGVIAKAVGADDLTYEQSGIADFHAELRDSGVSVDVADMMAEVGGTGTTSGAVDRRYPAPPAPCDDSRSVIRSNSSFSGSPMSRPNSVSP